MNRSHTNYRNPIGFKVTDNKLMVIEENKPELEVDEGTAQGDAIFKIALSIHKMMEQRSTMFVNNEPFFDIEGDKIIPLLNKVYIRYYEKF